MLLEGNLQFADNTPQVWLGYCVNVTYSLPPSAPMESKSLKGGQQFAEPSISQLVFGKMGAQKLNVTLKAYSEPSGAWEAELPDEATGLRVVVFAQSGVAVSDVIAANSLDKWRADNAHNTQITGYSAWPQRRSVAQVCEHRIVAVVGNCIVLPVAHGNCIVLPVAHGYRLDPSYKVAEGTTLYEAFYPDDLLTTPLTITLPTGGTFAEAIMGACNVCEKITDDRVQKWSDFPIDEPPAINPLDTASRYQNPGNLQTKDLAAPIVSIQNAPAVADPQGLNALSTLLGKNDIFKDITGLEGTQALANNAMLQNAISQKARIEAATAAMNALDKMKEKGQITDEQHKKGKEDVVSNMNAKGDVNYGKGQADTYNAQLDAINKNALLSDKQKQAYAGRLTEKSIANWTDNGSGNNLTAQVGGSGRNPVFSGYETPPVSTDTPQDGEEENIEMQLFNENNQKIWLQGYLLQEDGTYLGYYEYKDADIPTISSLPNYEAIYIIQNNMVQDLPVLSNNFTTIRRRQLLPGSNLRILKDIDGRVVSGIDFVRLASLISNEAGPSDKATINIACAMRNFVFNYNDAVVRSVTGNYTSLNLADIGNKKLKNYAYASNKSITKISDSVTNNSAKYGFAAAIYALLGSLDKTSGAVRWDGQDLVWQGFLHRKPAHEGINFIPTHFQEFKTWWSDLDHGGSKKFEANFVEGEHLATVGLYQGKIFHISTICEDGTVMWAPNLNDPRNQGVDMAWNMYLCMR